jgi:8-oxo-dGTP pyrophosphatase MutT (NUDIX family)
VTLDAVVERLQTALTAPLPGAAAQALMAPRPRRDWPAGFNMARVRHAAALLLVVPRGRDVAVVLTVRAHTLDRHGGQVSLPGGVIEPDETAQQAALREAHEEIGVPSTGVRILGALTPIDITVSGFRLHPIVAVAEVRPAFRAAPEEVARVLEVPLADLLNPERIVWRSMTGDGRRFEFPAFPHEDAEIWGATAMVLAEFLALLGWQGPHGNSQFTIEN